MWSLKQLGCIASPPKKRGHKGWGIKKIRYDRSKCTARTRLYVFSGWRWWIVNGSCVVGRFWAAFYNPCNGWTCQSLIPKVQAIGHGKHGIGWSYRLRLVVLEHPVFQLWRFLMGSKPLWWDELWEVSWESLHLDYCRCWFQTFFSHIISILDLENMNPIWTMLFHRARNPPPFRTSFDWKGRTAAMAVQRDWEERLGLSKFLSPCF